MAKIDLNDDSIIRDIYDCAMTVFSHGIAIPSDRHPCGWDWLDFDDVDEDILEYEFSTYDFSNGSYDEHEFTWMTLRQILKETEGRFLFEINTNIDWKE